MVVGANLDEPSVDLVHIVHRHYCFSLHSVSLPCNPSFIGKIRKRKINYTGFNSMEE